MLEDVLTPPVVSASSESYMEEPQRIPNYGSTQGNQCLLSAQPSAPVGRTPTLEDQQAEERQRAVQAVKDITTQHLPSKKTRCMTGMANLMIRWNCLYS